MRCGEDDTRRGPGLERFAQARGAQAPAIAGLQPWEVEVRLRRREIVAARLGEGQELRRDFDADRMQPEILRAGMAAAGAEETGERPLRAALQRLAIDVALCRSRRLASLLHGGGILPDGGALGKPQRSGLRSGSVISPGFVPRSALS